jgi:hypothetical protein
MEVPLRLLGRAGIGVRGMGVGAVDKEASQTRVYCVAQNATHRAARPDPSLRKERLLRMTRKLLLVPLRSRVG